MEEAGEEEAWISRRRLADPPGAKEPRRGARGQRRSVRRRRAGMRGLGMFLTVEEDFAAMDEVDETFVYEPYPARKIVYAGLPEGPKVEIETIAVVHRNSGRT